MTTNNAVNSPLAGTTGTGHFVGSTSATLVTPTLGAATATSVVFSPTTGGIIGTTTNDNAAAGTVGEYISSSVLIGAAVSMSNATPITIASISLTAGDWDVSGMFVSNPAAGTTSTAVAMGISTVNNTFGTVAAECNYASINGSFGANVIQAPVNGRMRISLSTTTTVYLVAQVSFSVSTMTGYGFIGARRAR
jgi:hypothetical protein